MKLLQGSALTIKSVDLFIAMPSSVCGHVRSETSVSGYERDRMVTRFCSQDDCLEIGWAAIVEGRHLQNKKTNKARRGEKSNQKPCAMAMRHSPAEL